jgi:hypothetical protein
MTGRNLKWLLTFIAVAVSIPAYAANYGVGGCNPNVVNFATIQSAVSSVPAGATILICPGTYFEQVTISQPLTLKGATFNNSNRAIIAVPAGVSVAPNVNSIDGTSFYAQVLVQNVNPPGPVNITGITVDGTGASEDCSLPNAVAGIFYAPGTTGTVNEVTARNQQSCSLSAGIWAENAAGATQTIIIQNSSVRNVDSSDIAVVSNQNPSTLAATVRANFLSMQGTFAAGVWDQGAGAAISSNFVTGGYDGIVASFGPNEQCCAGTISANTVADVSNGIVLFSGIAQNNKVANVHIAFDLFTNSSMLSNTSMNSAYGVVFNCSPGVSVSKNFFNDSQNGFYQAPTLITGNKNFNIDTLQTGTCP